MASRPAGGRRQVAGGRGGPGRSATQRAQHSVHGAARRSTTRTLSRNSRSPGVREGEEALSCSFCSRPRQPSTSCFVNLPICGQGAGGGSGWEQN